MTRLTRLQRRFYKKQRCQRGIRTAGNAEIIRGKRSGSAGRRHKQKCHGSSCHVNTKNILFICGGAFPDLEGIIKERLNKQASMGFLAELSDKYDNDKNIMQKEPMRI